MTTTKRIPWLAALALMALMLPMLAVAEYHLGPGDTIAISVFGEDDLSPKVRVDETGRIAYPFLGDLQVIGLTTDQLRELLVTGLRGDYLIDPKVAVSVATYRPFYVNGQVKSPGDFNYEPGMTVRKALSMAGGTTERASLKKIFLVRDGGKEGDRIRADLDTPVGPGDMITIEESFF